VQGSPCQISWSDHNESDTDAGSYYDHVWVTDAGGRTVFREEIRPDGLLAGRSAGHYVVWTPSAPGPHTAHVRLNAGEYAIPEERIDDNESQVSAVVWSATQQPPAPLQQGQAFGRGTLQRASNDRPREGRYRAPASNVSAAGPFTLTQFYVPNNEVTFEFAAIGVESTDPVEFQGPVDAEITVALSSTSDGAQLGQHGVRIVDQQRGYITFTGSAQDPLDTRCDYTVTVYNRINPNQGLTLRMWTWT